MNVRTISRVIVLAVLTLLGSGLAPGLPASVWAQAKPGWQSEWQRIIEAGRKEGKVIILGPPIREFGPQIRSAFQQATGIEVEYLGLPSGEQNVRIEREMATGRPNLDVLIGGAGDLLTVLPRGQLESIADKLVLPEVTDPKNWRRGQLKWTDDKQKKYMLQITEYVNTDLFVNADRVNPASITSWKDLLKPEYKGKIVGFNPTARGPGQATATYLLTKFGDRFIVDLYKGQNVAVITDSRQMVEMMVRGTPPIGIGLLNVTVETYRRQGFKLERVFPKDAPGSLVGGFGVLKILKGAPHPNAAAVFVNWYATKAGLEIQMKLTGEPSLRTDADRSLVASHLWPQPGVEYDIDQYTEEFYTQERPKVIKRVVELLGR